MTITLTSDQSHYLLRVIRLDVKDQLEVVGATMCWVGTCAEVAKQTITLEILSESPLPKPSSIHISLAQSLPKQDKMSDILRACTEIGVAEFIPLVTERTIAKPKDMATKRDRWEPVIWHATIQSKRYHLPALAAIHSIDTLISRLPEFDIGIVFWEDGSQNLFAQIRAKFAPQNAVKALIVIGPEGGLSASEVDRLVASGFISLRMNTPVLRVEHAGLVACAQLLAQFY